MYAHVNIILFLAMESTDGYLCMIHVYDSISDRISVILCLHFVARVTELCTIHNLQPDIC